MCRKGSRRPFLPPSHIQRIGDGTAVVQLTQGKVAAIDECDYDLVAGLRWVASKASDGLWYAQATIRTPEGKRTSLTMHRLLMGLGRGDHRHVDHEDGNGLNNRRDNLRIATVAQNARNRTKRKRTASKYKGVTFLKRQWNLSRPWKSTIYVDGRNRTVGYFATEEEAAAGYNIAAQSHYGEFARLNELPQPMTEV